jgi:uncharacterized protein (DUF983 family)
MTANIQWKNTDLCIDLFCACGEKTHFDGYFRQMLQCAKCEAVYRLDNEVKFRKPELPGKDLG